MDVFRHDHIPIDRHGEAASHVFQTLNKQLVNFRRSEHRNSPRSIFDTSGWRTPNKPAASTCLRPRALKMVSILNTSCALTKCSSAFGTPMSLNTLRLPILYPFLRLIAFSP